MDRLDEAAREICRRRLSAAHATCSTAEEWLACAPKDVDPFEVVKALMDKLKTEKIRIETPKPGDVTLIRKRA